MTPFAVTQRAARLAAELEQQSGDGRPWSVQAVLECLYRAGLTLDADLGTWPGGVTDVRAALQRLGVDP